MNVQRTAGSPRSVNAMPLSSGNLVLVSTGAGHFFAVLVSTGAEHLFAPTWRELENVNARMHDAFAPFN